MTNYLVTLVFKSSDEKLSALLPHINELMNKALTTKTFSRPPAHAAKSSINAALFVGLDSLSKKVGSMFAPT